MAGGAAIDLGAFAAAKNVGSTKYLVYNERANTARLDGNHHTHFKCDGAVAGHMVQFCDPVWQIDSASSSNLADSFSSRGFDPALSRMQLGEGTIAFRELPLGGDRLALALFLGSSAIGEAGWNVAETPALGVLCE